MLPLPNREYLFYGKRIVRDVFCYLALLLMPLVQNPLARHQVDDLPGTAAQTNSESYLLYITWSLRRSAPHPGGIERGGLGRVMRAAVPEAKQKLPSLFSVEKPPSPEKSKK